MTGTTPPPQKKKFFYKFGSQLCIFVHSYTFLAHDSICVRLSVRPSDTRVDQSKTVEVRIMKFSPFSFCRRGKFHPEILTGSSRAGH